MEEEKRRIIDKRKKEKFMMDDEYLNGQAKLCGWQGTIVYNSLCRHCNIDQESFPSVKLMAEQHGVSRNTIFKGIENLEKRNVIKVKKKRTKDGKWLNNTYILLDKSEWNYSQVLVEDTASQVLVVNHPSPCGEPDVVLVEDTKETHSEGNTYKETHIKNANAFLGSDISNLIEKFKPINPSYERLFPNKTQRSALERMVKKWGVEKVGAMIDQLPEIIIQKFAPKPTTPTELESKLGAIKAFLEQNKTKEREIIM